MSDEMIVLISSMQRQAEERVRQRMQALQLGEAFSDDVLEPRTRLLTTLIPTGMDSLILKKTPVRTSIRKAVRS